MYTIAIGIGVAGLVYLSGALGYCQKHLEKYATRLLIQHLRQDSGQEIFQIGDNKKYATITFSHSGIEYQVHLPYDRTFARKSLGCQVFLVYEDGRSEEITQKPGIPYCLKAGEMGGHHFEISKRGERSVLDPDSLPFN